MNLSNRYQGGGIDADHNFTCAYCGESNSLFVDGSATWFFDPSGSQRQLLSQECEACFEINVLTVTLNREGAVWIRAEKRDEEAEDDQD